VLTVATLRSNCILSNARSSIVIGGPQVGSELEWPGVQVPRQAGGEDIGSKSFAMDTLTGLVYDRPVPADAGEVRLAEQPVLHAEF
jgi:hypothetical protein